MAAFQSGRLTVAKGNRPAVKTRRQNVWIAESLYLAMDHELPYPVFDKIGPRLLGGAFKALGNPPLPHSVGVLWSDGFVDGIAQLRISKGPGYSQGLITPHDRLRDRPAFSLSPELRFENSGFFDFFD